jgi:hypothetical protein
MVIDQRNATFCPQRCCLLINGQPVSDSEYAIATGAGDNNPVRETQILCLRAEGNKKTADLAGFYLGKPVVTPAAEPFHQPTASLGTLGSQELFVYDAKTNLYRDIAKPEHITKWEQARREMIANKNKA